MIICKSEVTCFAKFVRFPRMPASLSGQVVDERLKNLPMYYFCDDLHALANG